MPRSRFFLLLLPFLMTACMSAGEHKSQVQDDSTDKLTVGTVQREIRVGMSGAEVAEVLGSPNMVSTDEQRREVWVYDKISTDTVYSSSQSGMSALVLGSVGNIGLGLGPKLSLVAGATSTSQRTLTILIKFDKNSLVRDFAYHASKF